MEETGFDRPELLAEPDWVEAAREDPGVCIVDCSGGYGHSWAYIPGAVTLPVHFSLKDPDDPLHVIGRQHFADLMGSMGIRRETVVVVYDRHGGMAAARLWWVLTYYGHPDVRLLNGGWHRWRVEGRRFTLNLRKPEPTRYVPRTNQAVLARLDYLRTHLDDGELQLLDVRNASEWAGHNPWGNRRIGHIPGAMHCEWINAITADDRRVIRPAEELHERLNRLRLSPEREVVTHCQAGIRASHTAFVLTLLGFPRVRNYDGSMKEWANRDDTPLAGGPPDPEPVELRPVLGLAT
jgi:thiosulfate/3-mercaptopyruvate sulfurtransferase